LHKFVCVYFIIVIKVNKDKVKKKSGMVYLKKNIRILASLMVILNMFRK